MNEINQFKNEIVECYRGWYNLELKVNGLSSASFVMIIDLADSNIGVGKNYSDLNQVRKALEHLLIAYDKLSLSHPQLLCISLKERMLQSLNYIEQNKNFKSVLEVGGISLSALKIHLASRGIKYREINRIDLDQQRTRLIETCNQLEDKYGTNALDEYQKKVFNHDEIANYFNTKVNKWYDILKRYLPKLNFPDYKIVLINSTDPYRAMVTFNENTFKINLNTNSFFTQQTLDYLVLHEFCGHIIHFDHIKNNIELSESFPFSQLILSHTQDIAYYEGIAQLIPYLLTEFFNSDICYEKLAIQFTDLQWATRYYCLIKLYEGSSLNDISNIHLEYLDESYENIKKYYTAVLNHPFFSIQTLSYYQSYSHYKTIFSSIKTTKEELERLLSNPDYEIQKRNSNA